MKALIAFLFAGGALGLMVWYDTAHPEVCVRWRTERVTRCLEHGFRNTCDAFGEPHEERICVQRGRR